MSDSALNTAQLTAKYPYVAGAEALFFKPPDGKPSFRFELPEVGYEFSDGFGIGSGVSLRVRYIQTTCAVPDVRLYRDHGHVLLQR